jgi:SAM-dependent methyltransferase
MDLLAGGVKRIVRGQAVTQDPLKGTPWSEAGTVSGFAQSPPNQTLIELAASRLDAGGTRLLDIGCGAGRNAVPLARQGWRVTGIDLSLSMLHAARQRAAAEAPGDHLQLALAPMEHLPVVDGSTDFIVAHGIWNLARSAVELRAAVREAARVARPGATLFLFTFSRSTLDDAAAPLPGETFVFTQFSGQPQCFLTSPQVAGELGAAGFEADPSLPLHELNKRPPGSLVVGNAPVIWEGMFRRCN